MDLSNPKLRQSYLDKIQANHFDLSFFRRPALPFPSLRPAPGPLL